MIIHDFSMPGLKRFFKCARIAAKAQRKAASSSPGSVLGPNMNCNDRVDVNS